MPEQKPTREQAYELLTEYNKSEGLINHALAVEAVMRYSARKHGQEEEPWAVVGLVHDLDYEQYPEEPCHKTAEIVRQRDWTEE